MVCRGHCFGNGLIMRAVGDRMIIAPPLVMTRAQIDEMVALIRHCLDLTLADVQAARLGLTASGPGLDSGTGFACSLATAAARLPASAFPFIPTTLIRRPSHEP